GAPGFRSLVAADYPAMVGDSGSGGTQGAVPAPPAGSASSAKFLKADGTWASPASGVTAAIAPSFSAYLASNQTAGVNIRVGINTIVFDTNNNFNTTTNRY